MSTPHLTDLPFLILHTQLKQVIGHFLGVHLCYLMLWLYLFLCIAILWTPSSWLGTHFFSDLHSSVLCLPVTIPLQHANAN